VKLFIDLTQTAVPAYFQRAGIPTVQHDFGRYMNDPVFGVKCDKCGRLLHGHLWQAVDDMGGVSPAGTVLECSEAA
jgi:hypothetical protein